MEQHVRSRVDVFRPWDASLSPGYHKWETNFLATRGGQEWRATGLECLTSILLQG